MQEHWKYCMQFSYFWTPVLVLREKPVLRESSDLQLEVCNTLLRFKPLTLLVCCEVKYHGFGSPFTFVARYVVNSDSSRTQLSIKTQDLNSKFNIQFSFAKHPLSKNRHYKTWQTTHSPLIAFYMHIVYIIIGTQNEIQITELYELTVILPVKAQRECVVWSRWLFKIGGKIHPE